MKSCVHDLVNFKGICPYNLIKSYRSNKYILNVKETFEVNYVK